MSVKSFMALLLPGGTGPIPVPEVSMGVKDAHPGPKLEGVNKEK